MRSNMLTISRPRVLLALSLSLLVACGGRVVVDGASPGGSGGAGGDDGGAAVAKAVCAAYCDRRASDGCAPTAGPCEEWCPAHYGFMGSCSDAYRAFLECFISEGFNVSPICQTSTNCGAELDAFLACNYPAGPCESHDCESTPSMPPYTCDHFCGGSVYTTDCEGPEPTCTCSFNGEPIATCDDIDLQGSCCTQHFALWK